MITTIKKEQETTAAMVRRFMQHVHSSGILKEAKSKKYFKKPTNKNVRRADAIEREKNRITRTMLRKLGRPI